MLTDILHLRIVQGGSTLTQQLVKNYFLTAERTVGRKVNEVFMALLLEGRFSKEEILEAYLNEIYLGQLGAVSIAGVEEASRLYFSKGVNQLTLAESALLAGMIRSPGEYSPLKNRSVAYDRRNFVLKTIREKGLITEAEFRQARKERIATAPPAQAARQPVFCRLSEGPAEGELRRSARLRGTPDLHDARCRGAGDGGGGSSAAPQGVGGVASGAEKIGG